MLSPELRDKIYDYLNSSVSLQELEEWLVPELPELYAEPLSDDAQVTAEIELALVEIADGTRHEDDLRKSLAQLIRQYPSLQVLYKSHEYNLSGNSSETVWPGHTSFAIPSNVERTQLSDGYTSF